MAVFSHNNLGDTVRREEMRSTLYQIARLMGDINALVKGKVITRLINKFIGRKVGGKLWRR